MAIRHPNRNGSVRVALYLRVSTGRQDHSIDDQRSELTRLISKRPDHKIVAEYLDEAISGDDTDRRVGFLQMRDDAQADKYDKVLVWDQDRFGRFDLIDGGHYIRPFRQAGIVLETIAQGVVDWEDLTGQLIYSVNQVGKAQFLRDLSRNTCRGILSAARECRAGTGGAAPFGYRSEGDRVWIVEDEAKTVRLIFRLYLAPGGSLRGVVIELNRRGIKTPKGKKWRASNVRAILVRRKYTGTFVYGDRNAGKYFAMRDGEVIPRRKSDKAISSDPVIHLDRFEAIIDQRTFDRAQAKLDDGQGNTAPRTARQYLLSGLVRCGDCGGRMGGRTKRNHPLYECSTYNQSGSSECHHNTIPEGALVSVIAKKIQDRYLSETALTRLRKKIEAKLADQDRPPSQHDLDRLRREIESLDQKIDRGTDRVLEAPDDLLPTIYRKLQDLRSDRDRLKTELQALTSRGERSNRRDGSEVDRVIEALRSLGEALQKATPADTKRLLASIVSKIELHFTEGTGRKKRDFTHGTIYIRPDAAEGRGTGSGSDVPLLYNKGPSVRQPSPPSADRLIAANSALFGRVAQRVQIRPCGGGRRVNDCLLPRAATCVGHIDLEHITFGELDALCCQNDDIYPSDGGAGHCHNPGCLGVGHLSRLARGTNILNAVTICGNLYDGPPRPSLWDGGSRRPRRAIVQNLSL